MPQNAQKSRNSERGAAPSTGVAPSADAAMASEHEIPSAAPPQTLSNSAIAQLQIAIATSPRLQNIARLQESMIRSPRVVTQKRRMQDWFSGAAGERADSPTPGAARDLASGSGQQTVQLKDDDWALKSNKKARRAIDQTDVGEEFEFRFDHGDEAGFGTTLHHHVSRAKMKDIVTAFKASQRKISKMSKRKDAEAIEELNTALVGFEKKINEIAEHAELDSPDLQTTMENLPLNLHYGPSIVKDNPGDRFDPSTRPVEGRDGERELEPTSAALEAFLNAYEAGVGAAEGDDLPAATWRAMTARMNEAFESYKTATNLIEGIAVNREQWVKTEENDTWAKRGGNKWPARTTAEERFAENVGPLPIGAAALSAHHDFTIASSGGGVVTFRAGYTGASLSHFCNRHTYRHFDPAEIKLLNTFFPPQSNQAYVIARCAEAFQRIEAEVGRQIAPNQEDYEITNQAETMLVPDGLTFKSGDRLICIISREDNWNDPAVDFGLDMVMMAPTGATFESYDAALLTDLDL